MLEQLVSPLVLQTTPAHAEMINLLPDLITRHHAHHYLGLAKSRWKVLIKESAWQVKPLLYVYRALLCGIHLMKTGEVEPNLVMLNEQYPLPYIPELIQRKMEGAEKGTLPDADKELHEGEYVRLSGMLQQAHEDSPLPENASAKAALNDLLIRVRLAD